MKYKFLKTWQASSGGLRAYTADYWLHVVATDYAWHWSVTRHDGTLVKAGAAITQRAAQNAAFAAYGKQVQHG
jgi:hypothetical protein